MKTYSLFSLISTIILLFCVSCKESTVSTPSEPKEEISIEEYIYNADSVHTDCRIKYSSMLISCVRSNIIAISKNKDRILLFGTLPSNYENGHFFSGQGIYVQNIQSNIQTFEPLDLTVLKTSNSNQYFDIMSAHFCPYDNDILLVNISTNTVEGTNQTFSYDWYYYSFSTKKFTRLVLNNPNHNYYKNNFNLVRWSSQSTPGNDQFIWENNTILKYPSGEIISNAIGRTLQENEKIYSISPDLKKVFTVQNKDLYLNGNIVPNSKYVFRNLTPISWSDDSKKFLGVGLPQNPKALLHIVYEMKEGSTTDFSMSKIIDLTRKHCSIQDPTFLLYTEELHSIFISDSTIAVNLALPSHRYPEISNINFEGEILQTYTFINR